MQEEVENRTVNLAISTSKLTVRTVMRGLRMFLNYHARGKAKKQAAKEAARVAKAREVPHGKQTVQELIGQNQGVSSIPVAKTELKGFERVARKYNVDFAIRKDTSVDPPRYTVFFKARDMDALTAAYKEYSAQALKRAKRPSVRERLARFAALVVSTPEKERTKDRERSL